MRFLLLVISTGAFLSSCGVVYKSPTVYDGETEAGVNVDLVPLTLYQADFANRLTPYTPKPLPAALQAFGAARVSDTSASLSPALSAQERSGFETRWPEPLPVHLYRLGIGDSLLFAPPTGAGSVVPGLSQSGLESAATIRQKYTVQDDGSISIPDIGRIRAEGLTLPQVEQAIFQALLERQKVPSFSVEIAEFNSQRVDVAGLVNQPSSLPITLAPLYLREALSAVGGSNVPNIEDVVVYLHRDGETYQMLLTDIYSNTTLGRQVLKDGDSIFVDALYSESRAKAYLDQQMSIFDRQSAARAADRAALAEQIENGSYPQDHVYLVGETRKQLQIDLPFEQTAKLADILFHKDVGGFELKTGDVSQIYVLRYSHLSGRVTAYHLNAKNVASLVVATKLEMRPNDFVFVAEQPITAWNRVIQQVVPSFVVTVAGAASGN